MRNVNFGLELFSVGGGKLKYVVYTPAIFYTWLLRRVGMLTKINITYTRRPVLSYSLAYARARKRFHPGIAAILGVMGPSHCKKSIHTHKDTYANARKCKRVCTGFMHRSLLLRVYAAVCCAFTPSAKQICAKFILNAH